MNLPLLSYFLCDGATEPNKITEKYLYDNHIMIKENF